MKTLKTIAGCIVMLTCLCMALQTSAQENNISIYTYAYVPPGNMPEFMNRMETYWYKVADAATTDNLAFFAFMTKMDGYDIPNNSNVLFITSFKDLEMMDGTFNPDKLFPNNSMEDMTIWNLATIKHRIYVSSGYWTEKAGSNPDTDFNYIQMVYHSSDTPADLMALENEYWLPFIKDAMDKGMTRQVAWGNARVIAPTSPDMGITSISYDLYPTMAAALNPGWSDDLVIPEEGMSKIMEQEKDPRTVYTYKIHHVAQAPEAN
ncbi:MAG: hypothetical protein P8X57_09325 [Cyclobacteriaceae bacterium]